jgi:hypothetical protein
MMRWDRGFYKRRRTKVRFRLQVLALTSALLVNPKVKYGSEDIRIMGDDS